ncbi:hypothetical protein ACFQWF_20215 [Methylorubrum suomiense]
MMIACEAAKNGVPGPSRIASPVLVIPAWEKACEAILVEDCVALGRRLSPVDRTEERVRRGRYEEAYPRAHYELAPGTVVVVAPGSGRVPHRAYVAGADGAMVEISFIEAGDRIDPAGTGRRAWQRRIRATGLTETPRRFRREPGHSFEADVVYGLYGQEHVALCTKAADRYVWLRAVTYAEAVSLGVA